jgi:hypothetical protein
MQELARMWNAYKATKANSSSAAAGGGSSGVRNVLTSPQPSIRDIFAVDDDDDDDEVTVVEKKAAVVSAASSKESEVIALDGV